MGNTPNDDVLYHILEACPTSTLAVLSLVSSHIRTLTWSHLLPTVYLGESPRQVFTFLDFIVRNTHETESRGIFGAGRNVIELNIANTALQVAVQDLGGLFFMDDKEYPISTCSHLLTRALPLMPNLCSFVLGNMVDEYCQHCPDLALALISRPRITSITLGNVGINASNHFGRALDLTKDAVGNLQIVNLTMNTDLEELDLFTDEGIGKVLFHSMASLTDISLDGCHLRGFLRDREVEQGHDDVTNPVIFPNVTKLFISDRDVSLKALTNAFPALQTLAVRFLKLWPGDNRPPQTHVSFPNLVSIEGRYQDLCTLLRFNSSRERIRRVVINGDWDTEENSATLDFSIPQTAPFLNSLHFNQRSIQPLSWWKALSHAIPHLTYLDFSFSYVSTTDEVDLVCVQIPRSLANVPLEYVSINLEGYNSNIGDCASPEIRSLVDATAIALSYAQNIPSLQYIDVCKRINFGNPESPPVLVSSWWRVVHEDSVSDDSVCIHVKVLDAWEGRSLQRGYDLLAYGTARDISSS